MILLRENIDLQLFYYGIDRRSSIRLFNSGEITLVNYFIPMKNRSSVVLFWWNNDCQLFYTGEITIHNWFILVKYRSFIVFLCNEISNVDLFWWNMDRQFFYLYESTNRKISFRQLFSFDEISINCFIIVIYWSVIVLLRRSIDLQVLFWCGIDRWSSIRILILVK